MTLYDLLNLTMGGAATVGAIIAARRMAPGRVLYLDRVPLDKKGEQSPRPPISESGPAARQFEDDVRQGLEDYVRSQLEDDRRRTRWPQGPSALAKISREVWRASRGLDSDRLPRFDSARESSGVRGMAECAEGPDAASDLAVSNATWRTGKFRLEVLERMSGAQLSSEQDKTIKRHERAISDLESRMRRLEEQTQGRSEAEPEENLSPKALASSVN